MSDFIKRLAADPVVAAARVRDEVQFFGQGWSHYPKAFEHVADGVCYYLSVYNTPNHKQVNWSLHDVGSRPLSCIEGEWLMFHMTPDESRALAASIGLSIADWLEAALGACRTDVTASAMARSGNVVDLDTFHMARSAGIEERGGE